MTELASEEQRSMQLHSFISKLPLGMCVGSCTGGPESSGKFWHVATGGIVALGKTLMPALS